MKLGTFSRPNPNVTRPITKAAMITPVIVPDPPNMLTPPRTTMVTTSNSIPIPIEGRVEPKREVRQTAAKPDIAPVIRNRINLMRFRKDREVTISAIKPMAAIFLYGLMNGDNLRRILKSCF